MKKFIKYLTFIIIFCSFFNINVKASENNYVYLRNVLNFKGSNYGKQKI